MAKIVKATTSKKTFGVRKKGRAKKSKNKHCRKTKSYKGQGR